MNHPIFDAYTKDFAKLLIYSAAEIPSFHLYGYEWIDNLHFMLSPSDVVGDASRRTALEEAVRRRFRDEAGWEGTGRLSLLWLPSFVFPLRSGVSSDGVIVWHVKQHEDGISCLLSPIPLPFEEFDQS